MISASSIRSAVNFAAEAADLALAAPAAGRRPAAGVKNARLQLPSLHGGSRALLAVARRGTRPAKRSRTGRSSVPGYAPRATASTKTATTKTAKTSTKTSASDPLSFLSDPSLSIEDKLMKLLGYMNDKWEKEMQKKLDQIGASEAGAKGSSAKSSSASSGSGSKKSSGLLGGLGDLVKTVFPPAGLALDALNVPIVRDVLSQVGGPVLAAGATALGFPEVAPFLLKYGPDVVKAVSGFAASLDGEGGGSSASSASSGTSSASGGSKAMTDSERQTIVMEIQRIQQKQQEMFSLVSNILKTNHDTRAAVIGNIR